MQWTILSISFTGNPVKLINYIKHTEMQKMTKMMGDPEEKLSNKKSESLVAEEIINN